MPKNISAATENQSVFLCSLTDYVGHAAQASHLAPLSLQLGRSRIAHTFFHKNGGLLQHTDPKSNKPPH